MARAEDWMHRWSDCVIVVSETLRRRVAARIDPSRLRVVRCGVPLAAPPSEEEIGAARRRFALPHGAKIAGTVGRLAAVKRHSLLLSAAAALPELHLLIVGDGPLAGPLRAEAEALGLAARVHFTGWTTSVSPLLSLMDVYVQCSDSEGFPVAVAEAMMLGRPIVSTAVGAIPELIRDDLSGLLVPRGDAPALTAAIRRLISDPDRARRLGQTARETAARHLDLRRTVAEIAAIYDEVIAERERRPLAPRAALP
jgi:glycosyltransferase involved in cell wall biosynthesis